MVLAILEKEKSLTQENTEKMLIGKLEGKLETVKKMLGSGIEVEAIGKLVDLSYEQVEAIRKH